MYVEAICPLCFATHIVPEELRGEEYRCEHCEELFIVNRKSKKTDKKPPRLPSVKPADDPEGEVANVEPVEILPEAKLAPKPTKKPRADEDEVLEIPDDALQSGQPVVRKMVASKRRVERDDDRPRKRRRDDEDEDDRPRRRAAGRGGMPVGLIVGIGAGVLLIGVIGLTLLAVFWVFPDASDNKPQPQVQAVPPANNVAQNPMQKGPVVVDPLQRQQPPPRPVEPPPQQAPLPRPEPPQQAPPQPEPPAVWKVKADPPAAPVKLLADFKKEIKAPGVMAQLSFPKQPSPFVAIGLNLRAGDERQVWNLQTGQLTGKVVGAVPTANGAPPVLSADGAYLAYYEKAGTVAVWAPGPGKKVTVEVGAAGFQPDHIDFAGDRLLTARQNGGTSWTFQTWEAATGKSLLSFTPTGRVTRLSRDAQAISPGGAYLALASRDTLWVCELQGGTTVGERALPKWEPGRFYTCRGLSFSPDGGELAGVFFANGTQPHLVCWDVATGEVVSDVTFPQALPDGAVQSVYKGHVIDWVGDRRGWLLYGYTLVSRNKSGTATFLAAPPREGSPVPRHMIGPAYVATLAPAGRPGEKVLTVSPFDADRPD
jgi:hypothetical protein